MSIDRFAPGSVLLIGAGPGTLDLLTVRGLRAIEAADVVLMDDDPAKIALAMRIARRTKSIVYQNIVFALAIKAACLLLGALGIANMWVAIFADVGVMVLANQTATSDIYTKDLTKK